MNSLKLRIKDLLVSIKMNGLLSTLKIIISSLEDLIDLKSSSLDFGGTKEISYNEGSERHQSVYLSSRAAPLKSLFKTLKLSNQQTFYDLGSGKGRVLYLAHAFGFEKLVGIEIDKDLNSIAKSNLKNLTNVHIHEGSFTTFDFDNNPKVIFLYDPASEEVINKLVANLKNKTSGLTIIYHNNLISTDSPFSQLGLSCKRFVLNGNNFLVYS